VPAARASDDGGRPRMFRRKQHPSIEVSKLSSLIAPGVEIVGVITEPIDVKDKRK